MVRRPPWVVSEGSVEAAEQQKESRKLAIGRLTARVSSTKAALGRWLTASGLQGETPVARASERNRRALVSSVAGLGLRGSSFLVVLVTVPLTLHYLGAVRFGLWMTIASIMTLLSATDLGIGNGVLNNVSRAFGRGDRTAARQYVSSGFVALGSVAALLIAIFIVAYPIVPWASLYNVASYPEAASEAGPATAAFFVCFCLSLPIGLVGQVRSAYQEGFIHSLFAGAGNAASLVLVVGAILAHLSLTGLVLAMSLGPLLLNIANALALFGWQRPWLKPSPWAVTRPAVHSVLGVGLAFLVLQAAYAVGFSSDRFVAAIVVGPVSVAEYSVVYRLFSVPAGLAAIALLPLWPAHAEATSRQDTEWSRHALKRSLWLVTAATVPLAVGLCVAGPLIVSIWTGGSLDPSLLLYVSLGAFTVVFAIASAYAMLLNGAQALRFQIVTMTAMAAVNICVSVFLASRIGVPGVAIGSVISVSLLLILPDALYTPRLLARLSKNRATTEAGLTHSPELTHA